LEWAAGFPERGWVSKEIVSMIEKMVISGEKPKE
jgi:hypothetical protein